MIHVDEDCEGLELV
jgi:hypothetical protein